MQETLNAILAELMAIDASGNPETEAHRLECAINKMYEHAGSDLRVTRLRISLPPQPTAASPYATVARAHASHLEQRRSQPRIVTQNGIKDSGGQG